jgi:hypothetical protein
MKNLNSNYPNPIQIMKSSIKNLTLASSILFAIFGGMVQGYSQATVTNYVDPTQTWIGYMNWSPVATDAGGYGGTGGSAWGTSALIAFFTDLSPNTLALQPNTNTYSATNVYWVNADGSGANVMDANMYVQNDALAGDTVVFQGTCVSNTLVAPYTCVAFIKDLVPSYASSYESTATLTTGGSFTISLVTTPGDHVQYGFDMDGPDANPTNLTNLGLVILGTQTNNPAFNPSFNSQAVVAGQNANFTSHPIGSTPFKIQWVQATPSGTTNVLANSSHISGATTNSLTITNVTTSDLGTYICLVTNSAGAISGSGSLFVNPLVTAETNLLMDPSFEQGDFNSTATPGWISFGGCALQNTNDFYANSSNYVSAYDGTNCCDLYGSSTVNGFYQANPASPGDVFTVSAEFYTPSSDQVSGANAAFVEVKFLDVSNNVLMDYQTSQVTSNSPPNTWITLTAPTNVYSGEYAFIGTQTSPAVVAPTNTAKVQAQATYSTPAYAPGSVYVDMFDLRLRAPALTHSVTNGNFNLTFPTYFGPNYNVYYKTNLASATWSTLTTVTGDGNVHTVSDPIGSTARFYMVQTQ